MSLDIFDKYDIRARLCALLFILAPIILDGYILVNEFRTLSFTIILLSVILSYSCLFTCWIRYNGNTIKTTDYIVTFLMPDSSEFSESSIKRYYKKIVEIEPNFAPLINMDKNNRILEDVSIWLRQKTRNEQYNLVKEESINYGFIRNIYSMKKIFLIIFSIFTFILLVIYYINYEYWNTFYVRIWASLIVHLITYLIWIFGVNNEILNFTSKKYARAIIETIDILK